MCDKATQKICATFYAFGMFLVGGAARRAQKKAEQTGRPAFEFALEAPLDEGAFRAF
jgi:hypothetical protein